MSASEAIQKLEKTNQRYWTAMVVALFCVIIGLVVALIVVARSLSVVQAQLAAQKVVAEQIRTSAEKQNDIFESKIDDVNKHLDCIAKFFTRQDRAGSVIENIDSCNIQKTDQTSFTFPLTLGQGTIQQQPSLGQSNTPSSPQSSATVSQPPQAAIQPEPSIQPAEPIPSEKPIEVLGVPVCVPLLQICVSR